MEYIRLYPTDLGGYIDVRKDQLIEIKLNIMEQWKTLSKQYPNKQPYKET